MKKVFVLLLFFLLLNILCSQVQFNLDYSIPGIDPDDEVQNIWLDDFDENGEEEIWILYTHEDVNQNMDYWRLTSYNLAGEQLSIFTKSYYADSTFKGCSLFNSNGISYRMELYENVITPVFQTYCIIKLYDYYTNTILDTLILDIDDPACSLPITFNPDFMEKFTIGDSDYIYLGFEQGFDHAIESCLETRLYKLLIDQSSMSLVEEISRGGQFLSYYEEDNALISCHQESWSAHPGPAAGFDYYIDLLSLDSPATYNNIQNGSYSSNYGQIMQMSENDFSYNNYGFISAFTIYHTIELKCYTPHLFSTMWEEELTMPSSVELYQSSCISIGGEDSYFIYFYEVSGSQLYTIEIRDRTNGEILLSQDSSLSPEVISRKQDGELLFFDYSYYSSQTDVYSIEVSINFPPVLVFPINNIEVEEDFPEAIAINLDYYFYDQNGDELTYAAYIEDNIAEVQIDDSILTISSMANMNGTTEITVIADDNNSSTCSRDTSGTSFQLTINPVNDPPEIISYSPEELSFEITEEQEISFEVNAEDIDSDLTYTWFVNNENQNIPDYLFTYQFSENGNYEIKCTINDEEFFLDTIWNISVNLAEINNSLTLPTQLLGNYPNPFNPSTTISFSVTQSSDFATIEIYNLKGQKVKTLPVSNSQSHAGSVSWDGTNQTNNPVSSGIYYYKLVVDGKTVDTKKCLLLK